MPSLEKEPKPLKPSELLKYLPAHKVLVCTVCQYAIQPNAVPRHLREIHQLFRSRRRPYIQYVAKFYLEDPSKVKAPGTGDFPVPLLRVEDGLLCGFKGCPHLCVTIKRMKSHWLSIHQQPAPDYLGWHSVPLQTFFRGTLLQYFTSPRYMAGSNIWDPPSSKASSSFNVECNLDSIPLIQPQSVEILSPSPIPTHNLDKVEASLLNLYLRSTCMTIANDQETEILWRVTIPQLANRHPFLMHGILACSALHMAHLEPTQKQQHVIRASSYQARAMPVFRSHVATRKKENCDAILAFLHLLLIYSFASEKQDESLFPVDCAAGEVFPSWLFFLHHCCTLLLDVWDDLETGPVKKLATMWHISTEAAEGSMLIVVNKLLSLIPSSDSTDAWSNEVCTIYRDAAGCLGAAFAGVESLGVSCTTWDVLRVWPILSTKEYMTLLHEYHPAALILLAHFCIILKRLECHWYFEGRAARLLSTILYRLPERWHTHIHWPIEEIRSG